MSQVLTRLTFLAFLVLSARFFKNHQGSFIYFFAVLPIRALGPLTIGFFLRAVWICYNKYIRGALSPRKWIGSLVAGWGCAELIFLFSYLLKKRRLSSIQHYVPENMAQTDDQRMEAFTAYLQNTEDIHRGTCSPAPTPVIQPKVMSRSTGSHNALDERGFVQSLTPFHTKRRAKSRSVEDLVRFYDDFIAEKGACIESLKTLKQTEVTSWFFHRSSGEVLDVTDIELIYEKNHEEFFGCFWFDRREPHEIVGHERSQMHDMLAQLSVWLGVPIRPGYNPKVGCLRLFMDPINSRWQPLAFVMPVSWILPMVESVTMSHLGFYEFRQGHLKYYYRRGRSSKPKPQRCAKRSDTLPIVFAHGLGCGVVMYSNFLRLLTDAMPDSDIFLVCLPHIAVRQEDSSPTPRELLGLCMDILGIWGFDKAHWVGHSFGTFIGSWVMKYQPQSVAGITLLDPVCIMLTKVMNNVYQRFIVNMENTIVDTMIRYFAILELHIAYNICRVSDWQLNMLWPQDIPANTLLVLCGEDKIVPSHSIRRLIETKNLKRQKNKIQVLWLEDQQHAGFLFMPNAWRATISTLRSFHEGCFNNLKKTQRLGYQENLDTRTLSSTM